MNLEKAWKLLKNNGFKETEKRDRILRQFSGNDKYLTARDLLDVLQKDYPGISYDTVYRNLATFTGLGILEETELSGERHFRMQCESAEHHHHFICTDCGKAKEILLCPMEMLTESLPAYKVESHKFEIYGTCPECQ
ncbi:Fur family transcriptional regulator [Indiicoccus explosivorum]|uniref:Fur family transcriptional regulator n=1 Tax=Indiicoccus explosivorum TaxID=1917864 RepID=UPI000B431CDD|nr:Fur family transcriptional regulator [Indiicoccus explosivorum]